MTHIAVKSAPSAATIEAAIPGVLKSEASVDANKLGAEPGKDSTVAIQEAIEKVVEKGGGTVYFSKPGVYLINGALKSGEALEYKYKGQILFPARKISEPRVSVKMLGAAAAPKRWDASPAEPAPESGVVLLSNTSEGYVFDAIPATKETGENSPFTNIFVSWENITVRSPGKPAGGALNMSAVIEIATRDLTIDTNVAGNAVKLAEGGGAALITPRFNNGAYVRISSTHIVGYSVGIDHSEHTYLDFVTINSCAVALAPHGNNFHSSIYAKVLTAKCPVVVQSKTGGKNGGAIRGTIDAEVSTEGEFALKYMVEDSENKLIGDLSIYCLKSLTSGWPVLGGRNLNLSNVNYGSVGWMSSYPIDTFTRVLDIAAMVGSADRTSHLWGIIEGKATTEAGVIKSEEAAAATMVNVRYFLQASGGSRTIKTTLTTGSGAYNIQQVVGRTVKNSNYMFIKWTGGVISINKSIAGSNTTLASSAASTVAASTTYEAAIKIYKEPGGAWRVAVVLAGKKIVAYTLNATDVEQLTETAGELLVQDGIRWVSDNKSTVKYFAVFPDASNEENSVVERGRSEPMVSGKITITAPSVTATNVIQLTPEGAIATVGAFTIAERKAGESFVVESTLVTGTARVNWVIYE